MRRYRILAVDPGTRAVGVAVLELGRGLEPEVVHHGAITTPRSATVPERLRVIYEGLESVLERARPDVVVVEDIFYGKNVRSALRIGEGRGVALLAAARAGVDVVEYPPAVIKQAVTGNGRASKAQVARMVCRVLELDESQVESPDAADALAIAFCHAGRARQRLLAAANPNRKRTGPAGSLQALIDRVDEGSHRKRARQGRQSKRTERKGRAAMTRTRNSVLLESHLEGVKLIGRGKVRDLYDLGEHLLVVASDRLSAFDVVLPTGIPDKGRVLTRLSVFWFETLGVPNHLVTADVKEMPRELHRFADQLEGRAMLVRRLKIVPVECVVRGYLAGSGWAEYKKRQSVCGVKLPAGLRESDRIPEPIFTPTTKATEGHDMPMTFAQVEDEVGADVAAALRDRSLEVYASAADFAASRGVILTDTKFEWGTAPDGPAGEIILADEVLTPDSSRFWDAESYRPGEKNEAFDKQFVRDYLNGLDWDKTPPGPELPDEVVEGTARRYREIYERLTGRAWS